MSNLNDFNREAKAALWVVLQWLLLAVPTGLVCGAVGTAFPLSVEYVTDPVAIAEAGIMATPALLVNGKVVSQGKVLAQSEIEELL